MNANAFAISNNSMKMHYIKPTKHSYMIVGNNQLPQQRYWNDWL